MKRFFTTLLILLIFPLCSFAEGMVIQGGVSLTSKVPQGFFGSWRVTAVMSYTNNERLFTSTTSDTWNLSKVNDVVTLTNPYTGAKASVDLQEVDGNTIKFVRKSNSRNENVTETPILTLNGENFYGTDRIVIEKYKFGELVRTDIVEYKITAQRISGNSADEFLR